MADATTTAEQSSRVTATRLTVGDGGVQPSEVVGTGTGDRVTRDDAARAVELSRAGRTIGVPLMPLAPTGHALCRVLGRHPLRNASIELEEGTATDHRDVHLGIAVDTDHRLVVSTVRRAQELTAAAPSERIADLAARTGSGDLAPDGGGGTITISITNTRSRCHWLDTTILDPPQVGILATTRIDRRPVVIAGDLGGDPLAIHQMSYLCLTYDHRSVDGADAVLVLTDLEQELQPADLLSGAA